MLPFAGVLSGRTELYFDDHFRFSTPIAGMFAEAMRGGHLPLWNPWVLTGTPLVAERGSMLAHPGMFLALLLPPGHAVGVLVVLLLGLLAAGATALLRELGVRPLLAASAGAAIGLSGPALSYTSNAPFLGTLAAWPLVLLAAVRLARGGGSPWAGGLALGLALLGGDLPGAALAALVACVLFVAAGGRVRAHWPRLAAALALALVIGAGSWYPVLWALPLSERGAGIAATEAGKWSFHPGELLGFLWPHPLGLPLPELTLWPFRWVGERLFLHSVYVGALLAGAAVLALRRGERAARALALTAVVLLVIASGATTPLWALSRPLFTFLRYPSKLAAPAALLLALAGAVVLERLLSRPRGLRVLGTVVAALAALGAVVGVIAQSGLARRAGAPEALVDAAAGALRLGCVRVGALAALAAGLGWLLERGRLRPLHGTAVLSALVFFDVFGTTVDLAWTRPTMTPACPAYLPALGPRGARAMRLAELTASRLALDEQAFTDEQLRHAALLQPMHNALCHAAVLEPYGLYVGEVAQAMANLATHNPLALAELTASDLLLVAPGSAAAWLTTALDGGRLVPLASSPAGAVVLRPTRALPRSFVADGATMAPAQEIPGRLASGAGTLLVGRERGLFGGRSVALGEADLPPSSPTPGQPTIVAVAPAAWRPGFAAYRVASAAPGLLVEVDAFVPGWRAYLDGREQTILQVNVFARAVVLPAGEHTVEWRFFPGWAVASLFASWGGLLVAAGVLVLRRRRPRPGADAQASHPIAEGRA